MRKFFSPIQTLSLAGVVVLALIGQVLIAPGFIGYSSREGEVLGLFSRRYLLLMGLYFAVMLGWLAVLLLRKRVQAWLARSFPRGWLLALTYAAVIGVWLLPLPELLKEFTLMNWLLLALALIACAPDRPTVWRRWLIVGGLLVAVWLVPMMITVMTTMNDSPDEAHYADMATSPFRVGGLYTRTWLRDHYIIEPGKGWSLAAYGWLLENVWFDVKMGRIWNFVAYVLAIIGIGAVTWRLYGKHAASVSALAAVFCHDFIPLVYYTPGHQLSAAATLVVFVALQARLGTRRHGLWHALTGLFAVLSMQLHTAGIVFAVGMSLFYVAEFALNAARRRPMRELLWPLVWFGVGAGIGSAIYYVFNIMLAGGLNAYLDFLVRERGQRLHAFRYVAWRVLIEAVVIIGGLGFLVWRRLPNDRLYLGMLAAVIMGINIADTQGYRHHYAPLYFVPIGALVVEGLKSAGMMRGHNWRSAAAAACVVGVFALHTVWTNIAWDNVVSVMQSGRLPTYGLVGVGETLRSYLRENDVLVSTHQLLWGMPEIERLYSSSAEPFVAERWSLSDPADVWERVAPTVIVRIDGYTDIRQGLEDYMARHDFQMCDAFVVQGIAVTVYRGSCQ